MAWYPSASCGVLVEPGTGAHSAWERRRGPQRSVASVRAAVAAAGAGPDGLREGLLPFGRTADVRAWGALVPAVAGLPPGPERLLRFRSLPPAPGRAGGRLRRLPGALPRPGR
jgi:hypothetical protein